MKIRKAKCLWCLKKYDQKSWITRKGPLKGQVITKVHCSTKCEKLFKAYLEGVILIEDLKGLRRKMRGRRKE